jgi:NADPH-dependent ferric siderophore reductase
VTDPIRVRREPDKFREARVTDLTRMSPYLTSVQLSGPDLEGFDRGLPAASVRLLVAELHRDVVIPTWNGNEFLLADGSRPTIRTLTPVRFDEDALQLEVQVVRHGNGPLSDWVAHVRIGDVVAVSGTGRGYEVDAEPRHLLVAGDESALPAITVLMRELRPDLEMTVLVEVRSAAARIEVPERPGSTVQWLPAHADATPSDALVAAVVATELSEDVRLWVAGEAAAMQRIRRNLFEERGLPRSSGVVRGYWKVAR